ncbi:hypothetical protein GPA19_21215 [Azoarcus indigens]|nr:hypothetical protein [Azoarcus indigens]
MELQERLAFRSIGALVGEFMPDGDTHRPVFSIEHLVDGRSALRLAGPQLLNPLLVLFQHRFPRLLPFPFLRAEIDAGNAIGNGQDDKTADGPDEHAGNEARQQPFPALFRIGAGELPKTLAASRLFSISQENNQRESAQEHRQLDKQMQSVHTTPCPGYPLLHCE